jgi:hypothetical protein
MENTSGSLIFTARVIVLLPVVPSINHLSTLRVFCYLYLQKLFESPKNATRYLLLRKIMFI